MNRVVRIFLSIALVATSVLGVAATAMALDVRISQPFGNIAESTFTSQNSETWLSIYIVEIFRYGVALAALLAVIMIMVGGFIWMTSASSGRVDLAKDYIKSALLGLVLALSAVLLLGIINPRLVEIQSVDVFDIQNAPSDQEDSGPDRGCCIIRSSTGYSCQEQAIEENCTDQGGRWRLNRACRNLTVCSNNTTCPDGWNLTPVESFDPLDICPNGMELLSNECYRCR